MSEKAWNVRKELIEKYRKGEITRAEFCNKWTALWCALKINAEE